MTALAIEPDTLRLMADQVWTTLLDPAPVPEHEVDFDVAIAGHVEVLGTWMGCVQVTTSVDGATALTAQMLALAPADVALDDLQDALGELANILGGSVKSCLADPARLSLPQVGAPSRWTVVETEPSLKVCSTWQGHPIVISVLDGDGEPLHDFVEPGGSRAA